MQRHSTLPEAYGKQIEVQASVEDLNNVADLERGHGLDAMKRQYDQQNWFLYDHPQKSEQRWDAPILLPKQDLPQIKPHIVPTSI